MHFFRHARKCLNSTSKHGKPFSITSAFICLLQDDHTSNDVHCLIRFYVTMSTEAVS